MSIDRSAKLREFIKAANDSLTRTEFKSAFDGVVRLVKLATAQLEQRIDARLSQLKAELQAPIEKKLAEVKDGKTPTESELKALILPLIPKVTNGETPTDDRLRALIAPLIPQVEDGDDGDDADEEAIIARIENDLPSLGERIRDALELLQGTNRLKFTAIDGLDEALTAHGKALLGSLGPGGGTSFSIQQSGVQKVQTPLALNFTGGGAPTITHGSNGVTSLSFPSGGAASVHSETPTGAIDGVNKSYTTANTITTVIGIWINGEFIHPSEYTTSGSGFTMSTALPATLSGASFTISYT